MTKDRLKYLLDRYLDNTATPEELKEYTDWYEQAGHTGAKLFDREDTAAAQAYSRELFAEIMHRIDTPAEPGLPATGKAYTLYLKWAAAALVAGAMFLLYHGLQPRRPAPVARQQPKDTAAGYFITVRNRTNSNSQLRLKDGSLAELFPGSELRYARDFGSRHRQVYLSGKGLFKVAKDPARAFTVYSGDVATTVLGTSFTVTAWPGKQEVTVALHTGKVMVKRNGKPGLQEIYLLPGQQVLCNSSTGKATVSKKNSEGEARNAAPGARTGFAATFEQAPLPAVLEAVEKGYGVTLRYDREATDSLLFSGSIRATDSLSQVLKRIALLYDLSVKQRGQQYIISKSH